MKKILFVLLIFIFVSCNVAAYEMPLDIKINSDYISAGAFIEDGTCYVQIRSICDALNVPISWNNGQVTICDYIKFNDSEELYKGNTAKNIGGSVYVPARYAADIFDMDIKWDSYYRVTFLKKGLKAQENCIINNYTDDEVLWLARIIEAESSSEPEDGKIAVGNVILNRVLDDEFPSTIYGVIFDKTYSIQFEPVMNGTVFNNPGYESIKAAKLSLLGYNTAGKSLYFMNPALASNNWIAENRIFYKTINNHDFYL